MSGQLYGMLFSILIILLSLIFQNKVFLGIFVSGKLPKKAWPFGMSWKEIQEDLKTLQTYQSEISQPVLIPQPVGIFKAKIADRAKKINMFIDETKEHIQQLEKEEY